MIWLPRFISGAFYYERQQVLYKAYKRSVPQQIIGPGKKSLPASIALDEIIALDYCFDFFGHHSYCGNKAVFLG